MSVCDGLLAAGPDNAGCEQAALAALDAARSAEGLGPAAVPSDFLALPPAEQLFILINDERTARGLAPVAGVVASLSSLAAQGAAANADPPLGALAGSGPWVFEATANWAADFSTAASVYDWMYDDGWGGSPATTTNETCTSPTSSGCWSHRFNILVPTPPGDVAVLGVASQPEPAGSAFAGLESDAMVLTFVPQSALSSLSLTWQ